MAFGLYLHFPFCQSKCVYCNFYKELYDHSEERRFFEAIRIETELAAESCYNYDRQIATIYVGGGTPSLIDPDLLQRWLEQVRRLFAVSRSVEISFEINPESNSRELLQALRQLGVNRPVFGAQSFESWLLTLLSRKHVLNQIHEAVYLVNALGFDNYGCHLLYGLPGQTGQMLSADLDQLVDLEPPHVSFCPLTVEPDTELAAQVRAGRLRLPEANLRRAFYQAGYEHLIESGYERYEVCSFAQPGHRCRHNLDRWTGGDYLGLGPSAHSFMSGRRYLNVADLNGYTEALKNGHRPSLEDRSGVGARTFEVLRLGLRTVQGIARDRFEAKFGGRLEDFLEPVQYRRLLESNRLIEEAGQLRLSADSLPAVDEITRQLLKPTSS